MVRRYSLSIRREESLLASHLSHFLGRNRTSDGIRAILISASRLGQAAKKPPAPPPPREARGNGDVLRTESVIPAVAGPHYRGRLGFIAAEPG